MTSFTTVLIEAIVVGISVVVFGTIMSNVVSFSWNKITGEPWGVAPMLLSLFLMGFGLHIIYELLGLNAYYVNYKNKTN